VTYKKTKQNKTKKNENEKRILVKSTRKKQKKDS